MKQIAPQILYSGYLLYDIPLHIIIDLCCQIGCVKPAINISYPKK